MPIGTFGSRNSGADGVEQRHGKEIRKNDQCQRDQQRRRNIQGLINFAARVNLRGRGLAQKPGDDERLADQVDDGNAVEMFRVMRNGQEKSRCRQ